MNDNPEAKGSPTPAAPRFVFIWEGKLLQSQQELVGPLLIWPLVERRPAGAFARFVVIKDNWGNSSGVPMDLEPNDRPTAADASSADAGEAALGFGAAAAQIRVHEDLGSLPLLLRDFRENSTVAVKYLVRRQSGRSTRVELVETSAVEFRDLKSDQARSSLFVGFVRGRRTEGPARPIVMTGPTILSENAPGHDAPTRIDVADAVLRAYEASKEGEGRRISAASVLVVPRADATLIGPAQTILPYEKAHVRVSAESVSAAPRDDDDVAKFPRIGVRIGANSGNQDELEPGIVFFHWDRISNAPRAGASLVPGTDSKALAWHRGTMQGSEVAFTFTMAGFGDVVGEMVGPRERIIPVFPDWPGNDPSFPYVQNEWTIAPYLWIGDRLMPLTVLSHPNVSVQDVVAATMEALDQEVARSAPTARAQRLSDLGRYLMPQSRGGDSELHRLIKAAIEQKPDGSVVTLDPYCELLRELGRQIKSENDPNEWPRLEQVFSFAAFEKMPHLHRALVVLRDFRRGLIDVPAGGHPSVPGGMDLLPIILRATDVSGADVARGERWLDAFGFDAMGQEQAFVAWELAKRESGRALLRQLMEMNVLPDCALLTDHFNGHAQQKLDAYQGYTSEQLQAAEAARDTKGHQRHADLLRQASERRRDQDGDVILYAMMLEVLDAMGATAPRS